MGNALNLPVKQTVEGEKVEMAEAEEEEGIATRKLLHFTQDDGSVSLIYLDVG